MGKSNNAPAVTLDLNIAEAEWLYRVLKAAEKIADDNMRDVISMSSSDPRSKFRASLSLAASLDAEAAGQISERISDQAPSVKKKDTPDQGEASD